MTLSSVSASVPDLLRLVAVPVFAWVAILDIRTRRVPGVVWIPLGALGAALLVWDARVASQTGVLAWEAFLIPATLSLGFVVPLAYLFWWFGGFGGADAKALLVLALLFPVAPSYAAGGWSFPLAATDVLLPFSLSILANGVLVGVTIPLVLAVRNALAGRIAPVMFVGWPIGWERVPTTHGRLLQSPDGLTLRGVDLDAVRMYLRWRGLSLVELRADSAQYRDPDSLPAEPNPPTDGAVESARLLPDGGEDAELDESTELVDDPWGAAAFLRSIDGTAYGTSPETLRDGLEVLVDEEVVWISPGTPFLVPLFVGLLIALVYGDLLVTLLL